MGRLKKVQPPADQGKNFNPATVPHNPTTEPTGNMTVTFTGDPRGGKDPDPAVYGGREFPKGKAVTIDDAGWIAIYGATLRKNNHFKVE